MLGDSPLPKEFVGIFSDRFQFLGEDGKALSTERRSGRTIQTFLGHLASYLDPVLGVKRLKLMGVNKDGTVHLLHSLFSVPVGLYSLDR